MSTADDAVVARIEQSGFDIKYQEQLRRYLEREDNLRQGLTKAYALIFGNYCTKAMQSRVEAHPDFENEIENDPIKLLEVIKVFMHTAAFLLAGLRTWPLEGVGGIARGPAH
ncbi:MAG: hypothetical protein ACP5EP_13105, partial [Acidobacteriaceae bacterium]